MKGFGLVGIQGIGLVQVLWDVRYGSGPGYVGCRIIDSCHLITPDQGAESRMWRVCHACYGGGVMSGHCNLHCTALTHP